MPAHILIILAIACGTLFFRLGSLPLSGADEPRYARISQEMAAGGAWVTPVLEGKPWLEKPPLYYWITIPFYSVSNAGAEAAARLGPALCALIAALAIFRLGSALWPGNAGLFGAIIFLTSLGIAGFGRSASTDMPFVCCFTLAMSLLTGSAGVASAGLKNATFLAYIFLGLAVLAKGPVALVLAAGIMLCAWYLDESGTRLRRWRVFPGIVITAAVSLPWFWLVFRENGFSFISTFFLNHNIARYVTGIHHHSQPFYYYIPVLIALLFPWSGWLPLLARKSPGQAFRRWREWDPDAVFLASWFLVPVVFFSISDSKLAGYILPSIPPLSLLLGRAVSRAIEEKRRLRAAAIAPLVLSALMAIAAPIAFGREYGGHWGVGLLLSAAILGPALISFVFGLRGDWVRAFGAAALQGVLLIVIVAQFAFPVLGAYHSTREIARRALQVREAGEPVVTYRFFHHSLHYYTGYQVAGKLDDAASLVRFAGTHASSLVVTNAQGAAEISGMNEIAASLLGTQGNFRLLRISWNVER